MAKRKAPRKAARTKGGRKRTAARASVKRPKASAQRRKATAPKKRPAQAKRAKPARKPAARAKAARAPKKKTAATAPLRQAPNLNRERRRLTDDPATLATPPSSLNLNRRGSAARTGRAEIEQHDRDYGSMRAVTAGDPDADVDNAYFSGDEAPGGDNSTPDQDVVEEIGQALGVEYADNEELRSGDKLEERDKHRWELDPASSEDYKDRD